MCPEQVHNALMLVHTPLCLPTTKKEKVKLFTCLWTAFKTVASIKKRKLLITVEALQACFIRIL